MEATEAKQIVEALLFASDVPLTAARIRSVLGEADTASIHRAIDDLNQEYVAGGRSFEIRRVAQGFQLYTRPAFAHYVHELYKGRRPPRLSAAALETLAIVAYHQPALRAELEHVRGVNVDGVLATLLERGLIGVVGRDDRPGRPIQYGTTREFLRYFGLNDLRDLPRLEQLESFLLEREKAREAAAEVEPDLPGQTVSVAAYPPQPAIAEEAQSESKLRPEATA